ncbi:hypothetical protein FI667_g15619, partial [Globisporangium splendens]
MKTVYVLAAAHLASTSTAQAICQATDGLSILQWMFACESVAGDSAAKCADSACHAALHRLEEEETHECWEHLGLGTHDDFRKYGELDAFCHGEGPDPELAPTPANSTQA